MVIKLNKEFWLRLKEIYEPSTNAVHTPGFCYFSKEFESVWMTPQDQDVIDLADQFLESEEGKPFSDLFQTDIGFLLFVSEKTVPIQEKIEVRKHFLEWLIKTIDNETSETI